MKARNNILRLVAVGAMALSLAGCVGYDQRAGNTMLGAGLGAAAGGMVSEGDPLYMLGGAAAGGLLGNVLTADNGYHRGYYDNGRRHRDWNRNGWNRSHDRDWRDRDRDRREWRDRDRDSRWNRSRSFNSRDLPRRGEAGTPFGRASRGGDNFNK